MLSGKVKEYVNAAFSGIWLETREPDEAQREIAGLTDDDITVLVWDVAQGVYLPGKTPAGQGVNDPIAPLKMARDAALSNGGSTIMLLHNYHRFLTNPLVVQTLFNTVQAGKCIAEDKRLCVVILAPIVQIPAELEKVMVVLEHELPTRTDLATIAEETTGDKKAPEAAVLDAAAGLTRYEAEGAFALSLTRHDELRPKDIWEIKGASLKKSGLAKLYRGTESLDQMGGRKHLVNLCLKMLRPDNPYPGKGYVIVSPPGCGKTFLAKALSNATGLPLILGDLGALMGGLVGESQRLMRQFIALCDAQAPAIVLLDEIEKALAGSTSKHQGDNGVSADQLRSLLTWRQDSLAKVFVLATCNDASQLTEMSGGALLREGRFDGVVYMDLPDDAEKAEIWTIHKKKYGRRANEATPEDKDWTPAEIEACCRKATQYDVTLEKAALYVSHISAQQVADLREWASGRCLSATYDGLYQRDQSVPTTARRSIKARAS